MKVKVLRHFLDKQNSVIHPVDKIIEVTEERFEEIIAADNENPFVVEVDESDSILKSNVNSIKETVNADLGKEKLQELLEEEKSGGNRKGVIEHIEELLKKMINNG